mgnify:CR=1 FL=1
MSDGVGLSVGATNLAAVVVGRTAVTRSAGGDAVPAPAARGGACPAKTPTSPSAA